MSNFGAKRTTLKDVNKDRFAFMFASMVGRKVTLKVRNLTTFEGVFSGSIMEKGEYTVLLKCARELPSETRLSGPVHDQMLIPGKEVVSMTAMDVPEEGTESGSSDDKSKEFKTDSEINTRRFQSRGERQLQSWADLREDGGHHDMELETHSAGWSTGADQFVVAKQMGVVSTYREELYTTPLNVDSLTKEQRERADRLAKEIEGGRNYSSQEEGGDGDEEAMFSAVVGTGAYKKQQHPSDTAPSWRRAEDPARNSNTRLNALNLEPAAVRGPSDPKPPTAAVLSKPTPPPRPVSPTSVSEMKGINALNLEPAAVTRASAWDAKYKAGAARGATPGAAAPVSQPTKKDFEIALAEIKSREHRGKTTSGTKRSGAVSPSEGASVSPQAASGTSAAAAAAAASKFSFNPNASTFTPGGAGAPASAPGAPALSIAITPGGSLSGTLKAANYDYYEAGAAGGVPPPMPPPPMVMYPPPPFGMPMMAPPPMGPPPSFAPLCESGQLERVAVSETLSRFMDRTATSTSSSSSVSWTSKNGGTDKALASYKDILGNVPVGIGPIMPPPAAMMPPHPMMMPPMMAGPMYGVPAGYAPYYPPPPVAMPVAGGGPRRGMHYGGYPPQQPGGGYGRYRGGSGHASSSPPPSE
jgi:hypothetical protein